jgi:streptogramin lyase
MRIDARLGLVAGVCVLLTACSSSAPSTSPSSSSPAAPPSSVPATSSPTVPVLVAPDDIEEAGASRLQVPGGMDWIITAGGDAWTSNEAITRIDGRTGKVLATIQITGATCLAPAVAYRSLWFAVCGTPQMIRIDVATGKVVARIPLKVTDLREESSVAAGAGGVHVLSNSGEIVTIDPSTNQVVRVARARAGTSALRAGDDVVWATIHELDSVVRLDPRTLEVTATVDVGNGPQFLAVGEGAVWTLDQEGGTVTRVDPRTATVVATIPVDTGTIIGGDIAVGGGYVWARVTDQLVAKIDPRTNAVVARYAPASGSGGAAADATTAWFTAHDSDSVYQLPLR